MSGTTEPATPRPPLVADHPTTPSELRGALVIIDRHVHNCLYDAAWPRLAMNTWPGTFTTSVGVRDAAVVEVERRAGHTLREMTTTATRAS